MKYQTVDFGFWFRFGFAWGDGQGGHEWDDFKTIFILVFLLICFSLIEGEEQRAKWSKTEGFRKLVFTIVILLFDFMSGLQVFSFRFCERIKKIECVCQDDSSMREFP